jgi:GntR family transcriptional regulator
MVSSGQLAQGEMLPSIRSLATELEVNMMTVSKAYGRLEAEGILERVRGTGMRVRDASPQGSLAERRAELVPLIESMVTRAQQLDLSEPQIIAAVRGVLKERKTWQKT